MTENDRIYFARRAAAEFDMSLTSPSASARAVHAEMARRYAGLKNAIVEILPGFHAEAAIATAVHRGSARR